MLNSKKENDLLWTTYFQWLIYIKVTAIGVPQKLPGQRSLNHVNYVYTYLKLLGIDLC